MVIDDDYIYLQVVKAYTKGIVRLTDNIIVKVNKISDETKSVLVEDYVGDVQRKHRFKKELR